MALTGSKHLAAPGVGPDGNWRLSLDELGGASLTSGGMRMLPAGTVTLLFTDIEGSTRLLEELGPERYAKSLAEHRRSLREAFAEHGGVEVDTQGDAFFYAFARATDAAAAAIQAQQDLESIGIRVRMGLHTGEPVSTDEGYVGVDVHRAARLTSAGHGGQVLVSQATSDLLDERFRLRDLGPHRLKDLTAPQRLYQLIVPNLPADFPPLKTLYGANLPLQPTPLVGREQELEQAMVLLRRHRLVTLTGTGGSGKTRLALQLAADLADEFPDGVWWVPLQAVVDAELVESTIAQTVGARNGLAQHIGDSRMLLLLDNFEQVLDAGPTLAGLVHATPYLTMLITSREPLRVAGEQRYSVEPLRVDEAVALFVDRARAIAPEFVPSDAVAAICARLDGLPLAIELAAARTNLLTPDQLLARLEKRLPLLTGGARDAPQRQRTLHATIAWSYELLTPEEQRLFARLSVFAGGFTLEAAEAVCGADLDTLQSLIDRSLLRRWGSGRLGMLETIHEYAAERLTERDEADAVRTSHAEYYTRLVEDIDPDLRGPKQPEALRLLETEHDNMRAALDHVAASQPDLETRLLAASWYFWHVHGHFREGQSRLEHGLLRAETGTVQRAQLLDGLVLMLFPPGRELERAALIAGESLAIRRALHEEGEGLLRSLLNAGLAAAGRARAEEATPLFEELIESARRGGNEWYLALGLGNLSDIALQVGAFEDAARHAREALAMFERLGDRDSVAGALGNLAAAELELGNPRAGADYRRALTAAREIESPDATVMSFDGLAAAAVRAGDLERAAFLIGAADTLTANTGAHGKLWPFEESRRAKTEAALRNGLPPDVLRRERSRGAAATLDEVVALALVALENVEAPRIAPRD